MEDVKVIQEFLRIRGYGSGSGDGDGDGSGYGDGDGSGYGSGSGDGSGDGSGYGDGDGSGYGSGSGSGSGYGYGYGLKEYNGETIWYVDDVPTLIDQVHGDYARGRIINGDMTTTPCYITRVENSFAHGDTLKSAYADAEAKAMEKMPLEERISKFKTEFPSLQCSATCAEFYKWHHILTGSCTMGRDQFVKSHGLDMEREYTVEYFLSITSDAYGRDAIRKLKEMYNNGSQTAK